MQSGHATTLLLVESTAFATMVATGDVTVTEVEEKYLPRLESADARYTSEGDPIGPP